jgi:hypothetical protein
MYDDHDKIYEIILSTAVARKYLSAFLEEPLPDETTVTIVFDLEDKACAIDFTDSDGFCSPEGYSEDWEGSLSWLAENGYSYAAAEIRELMKAAQ